MKITHTYETQSGNIINAHVNDKGEVFKELASGNFKKLKIKPDNLKSKYDSYVLLNASAEVKRHVLDNCSVIGWWDRDTDMKEHNISAYADGTFMLNSHQLYDNAITITENEFRKRVGMAPMESKEWIPREEAEKATHYRYYSGNNPTDIELFKVDGKDISFWSQGFQGWCAAFSELEDLTSLGRKPHETREAFEEAEALASADWRSDNGLFYRDNNGALELYKMSNKTWFTSLFNDINDAADRHNCNYIELKRKPEKKTKLVPYDAKFVTDSTEFYWDGEKVSDPIELPSRDELDVDCMVKYDKHWHALSKGNIKMTVPVTHRVTLEFDSEAVAKSVADKYDGIVEEI